MGAGERRQTVHSKRRAAPFELKLQALTDEERQSYQLLSGISLPAALYRQRDKIILTNRQLDDLYGFPRGEMWGRTSDLLFYRLGDRRRLRKVLPVQQNVEAFEAEGRRFDGSPFQMRAWVGRTACHGQECLLAIMCDISEEAQVLQREVVKRKAIEQLLNLSEREHELLTCEMHDGFVQDVTAALMHVEAAYRAIKKGKPEAIEELMRVAGLLREGLAEARRLIDRVRPPDLDRTGLVEAIRLLVQRVSDLSVIAIDFQPNISFSRLSPNVETSVYRMIQEALNNVRKHSHADKALVKLGEDGDRLQIVVRDWGVGFDPDRQDEKHFGLSGLRQRARLLNGSVQVVSAPGQGTTVAINLPRTAEDGPAENS